MILEETESRICSHFSTLFTAGEQADSRSQERPRIGILSSNGILRDGRWPVYGADQPTTDAIFEAGGFPIGISTFPIIRGLDPFEILTSAEVFCSIFDVIWPVVRDMDGMIFSGGGDLDPRLFYGQPPHPQTQAPDTWRDIWEWFASLLCWVTYKPVLGICRGLQLMNVVRGGGLFQDHQELKRHSKPMPLLLVHRKGRPTVTNWTDHPLIMKQQSWLATVLRGEKACSPPCYYLDAVLTQHHQFVGYVKPNSEEVVGYLAPGLRVAAYAPDGVIEAIEDADPHRVYVAVQFHPEYVTHFEWARNIFRYLVNASETYAAISRTSLESYREEILSWLWRYGRSRFSLPTRAAPAPISSERTDRFEE